MLEKALEKAFGGEAFKRSSFFSGPPFQNASFFPKCLLSKMLLFPRPFFPRFSNVFQGFLFSKFSNVSKAAFSTPFSSFFFGFLDFWFFQGLRTSRGSHLVDLIPLYITDSEFERSEPKKGSKVRFLVSVRNAFRAKRTETKNQTLEA